jgi:hypothetical protein
MEIAGLSAILLLFVAIIFEYRLRRPDEWALTEKGENIVRRSGRFYPRHFTLAFRANHYSMSQEMTADVRGLLSVKITYTLTVVPDGANISPLIRAGGWQKDLVQNAARELLIESQTIIRQACEALALEDLQSKGIRQALLEQKEHFRQAYGLELISVNIPLLAPVDPLIGEKLQEREAARIEQETERIRQETRIAREELRLQAEQKIAAENQKLELLRQQLQQEREKAENELAALRVESEAARRKILLATEKAELELAAAHPETLLTNPQLARLLEAGQSLKNAQTVVSFGEMKDGSPLKEWLPELLSTLLNRLDNKMRQEEKSK